MTTIAPISTINDLFRRVAAAANPRAVLWQDEFGQWQPISSDQIYQRVRALAEVFLDWGAQKGDRIALIAENRWEWAVTDFATLAIGAADVPIYPTLTGEQVAALVSDAGCRIAVVSTRQQFDKLNSVRALTQLERIIIMDSPAPEGAIAFSSLMAGADDRNSHRDPVFDALVRTVEPKDLATLIYTSGTTGEPKGVALTHGNIAANQSYAAADFSFDSTDACISFLPLSHITARALDYVMYYSGAQVAYCSHFDKLPQAMREIKPTVIVGVPRVYEKIRQEVERRAALSPVKKRLLAWALALGSSHCDTVYDGRKPASLLWKLASKLVFSKVREAFGGRVRIFISGGAPLGIDTAKWFASAGIALWEGYGLTETSPVIALNTPLRHRMGAAGFPLRNIELKLADDGELLVRGDPRSFPATGTSPKPMPGSPATGLRRRGGMPSVSMPRAGSGPETSPTLTLTASCSSPIEKRNSSRPRAARWLRPSPLKTSSRTACSSPRLPSSATSISSSPPSSRLTLLPSKSGPGTTASTPNLVLNWSPTTASLPSMAKSSVRSTAPSPTLKLSSASASSQRSGPRRPAN